MMSNEKLPVKSRTFFRNAYKCIVVHVCIFFFYSWCNLWIIKMTNSIFWIFIFGYFGYTWLYPLISNSSFQKTGKHGEKKYYVEWLLHFITAFSVCVCFFFIMMEIFMWLTLKRWTKPFSCCYVYMYFILCTRSFQQEHEISMQALNSWCFPF